METESFARSINLLDCPEALQIIHMTDSTDYLLLLAIIVQKLNTGRLRDVLIIISITSRELSEKLDQLFSITYSFRKLFADPEVIAGDLLFMCDRSRRVFMSVMAENVEELVCASAAVKEDRRIFTFHDLRAGSGQETMATKAGNHAVATTVRPLTESSTTLGEEWRESNPTVPYFGASPLEAAPPIANGSDDGSKYKKARPVRARRGQREQPDLLRKWCLQTTDRAIARLGSHILRTMRARAHRQASSVVVWHECSSPYFLRGMLELTYSGQLDITWRVVVAQNLCRNLANLEVTLRLGPVAGPELRIGDPMLSTWPPYTSMDALLHAASRNSWMVPLVLLDYESLGLSPASYRFLPSFMDLWTHLTCREEILDMLQYVQIQLHSAVARLYDMTELNLRPNSDVFRRAVDTTVAFADFPFATRFEAVLQSYFMGSFDRIDINTSPSKAGKPPHASGSYTLNTGKTIDEIDATWHPYGARPCSLPLAQCTAMKDAAARPRHNQSHASLQAGFRDDYFLLKRPTPYDGLHPSLLSAGNVYVVKPTRPGLPLSELLCADYRQFMQGMHASHAFSVDGHELDASSWKPQLDEIAKVCCRLNNMLNDESALARDLQAAEGYRRVLQAILGSSFILYMRRICESVGCRL